MRQGILWHCAGWGAQEESFLVCVVMGLLELWATLGWMVFKGNPSQNFHEIEIVGLSMLRQHTQVSLPQLVEYC